MEDLDVVAATITRARDAAEQELILRTVQSLGRMGIPVFASDGGSPESFTNRLAQLGTVTLVPPDGPGLVGQLKASVRAARQLPGRRVLYLESDKALFAETGVAPFLRAAPDDAAVVLASRSAASFATFPPFQQRTESAFNTVAADVLGLPGDYLYGPFLMAAAVTPLVELAAPEAGWGWRPFVFASAAQAGFRLHMVEGDYSCPPEQRDETPAERSHRLRQLRENVDGLLHAVQRAVRATGP